MTKYYTYKGKRYKLKELGELSSLTHQGIGVRLKNGWTVEQAVDRPKQFKGQIITQKNMLRRFKERVCDDCFSWGGWYSKDKYGVEIWEECIFCSFAIKGWHNMRY